MKGKLISVMACVIVGLFLTNVASGVVSANTTTRSPSSVWDSGDANQIIRFMAQNYDNAGTPDYKGDDTWTFTNPEDTSVAIEIFGILNTIDNFRESYPDDLSEWAGSWIIPVEGFDLVYDVISDDDFQYNIWVALSTFDIAGEQKDMVISFLNEVAGDVKDMDMSSLTDAHAHPESYIHKSSLDVGGEWIGKIGDKLTIVINSADFVVQAYFNARIMNDINGLSSGYTGPYTSAVSTICNYEYWVGAGEIAWIIPSLIIQWAGSTVGAKIGILAGGFAGKVIGGVAGGLVGAALGGAPAVPVGAAGMAIGAAAGSFLGGIAGSIIGGKIGETIANEAYNTLCDLEILFQAGLDKFNRYWIEENVQVEIIDIYTTGNDNYVPWADIAYVKIKNTGPARATFVVSPISDNWILLPTLDFNWHIIRQIILSPIIDNTKEIELDPGEEATLMFSVYPYNLPLQASIPPLTKYFKDNVGFTVWYKLGSTSITLIGQHFGQKYLTSKTEIFISSPSPAFHIEAESQSPSYFPGMTATTSIEVQNVGTEQGAFTLGVSYGGPTGIVTHASSVTPYGAVMNPGESMTFTATVQIPSVAPKGLYQIAVNCWWDPFVGDSIYLDDLEWQNIFYVGTPEMSIITPSETQKARVGSYLNPTSDFISDVSVYDSDTNQPVIGLTQANFKATIGTEKTDISCLPYNYDTNSYRFRIKPPAQATGGDYDLKLDMELGGKVVAASTNPNSVSYSDGQTKNVDVVLVIDRSGSMGGQPIADAKEAAKIFVSNMNIDDFAGVVSFEWAGSTTNDYYLSRITSLADKLAIQSTIDGIYASGNTAIGEGLRYALNQLTNPAIQHPNPDAILLMSDGQHNSGESPYDVLPEINAAGIKVFTIGLGSVNPTTMTDIAASTEGTYMYAPSSQDLLNIYNQLCGVISGRSTIMSSFSTINPYETELFSAFVDPSMTSVTFSSIIGGSEIDFTLISPDGERITESNSASSGHTFDAVGTYKAYTLNNPTPGMWTMEVYGKDVVYGEPVTVNLISDAQLTLTADTAKSQYKMGEPIHIVSSVLLPTNTKIEGLAVTCEIKTPSGKIDTIYLYDDGKHGDGGSNDGTFANYYTKYTASGNYMLTTKAIGITDSGDIFERTKQHTVYVSGTYFPTIYALSNSYSVNARQNGGGSAQIEIRASQPLFGTLSALQFSNENFTIPASSLVLDRQILEFDGTNSTTANLTIKVPPQTPVGTYQGEILVTSSSIVKIPVTLEVKEFQVGLSKGSVCKDNITPGSSISESISINLAGYGGLENLKLVTTGNIANWTDAQLLTTSIPENGTSEITLSIDIPDDAANGTYYGTIYLTADEISPIPIGVEVLVIKEANIDDDGDGDIEPPLPPKADAFSMPYNLIAISLGIVILLLVVAIIIKKPKGKKKNKSK